MNTNQLKYVVTIAEELNITKAAKRLFVSQSSLSQAIKNIEQELKIKLFETNVTPLKLTYAGEVYVAWAKKTLASQEDIMEKLEEISTNSDVRIIVGVASHRSISILPQVIKDFKQELPHSFIVIKEYPTPILHKMLEKEELDLLLDVSNSDVVSYSSELLKEEEIYLDIAKNLKTKGEKINLSDLKDCDFILLSKEQMLGKLARELCKKCKFEPKISVECRNIETSHELVKQGLGISFVPELYAKNNQDGLTNFVKITPFLPTRPISAIFSNKVKSKAFTRFLEILKDTLNKA